MFQIKLYVTSLRGFYRWTVRKKYLKTVEFLRELRNLRIFNGQCSCFETTKWLEVDIFPKLLRVSQALLSR